MSSYDSGPLQFDRDKIEFIKTPAKKKLQTLMVINNTSASPIIYKVKTTTQTRYAVKPNTGCIPSNTQIKISIFLLLNEVSDIASIRDKFQIQYMLVSSDENWTDNSISAEWKKKENKGKELRNTFPVSVKEESINENQGPEGLSSSLPPIEEVVTSQPIFEST